ncbi:MAG: TonB-dependent receptor [Alphaproteobacteria bacterium]
MNITKFVIAFAIIFSSFVFEKTYAQTSEASEYTVEEIIVTARKRSESIQDVPVAVSALSIEQVERGNIQRVQDLEKLVPNVEISDMAFAGGAMSAGIRGLTFDDLEKTFETTVGVVIDGVFAASNSGVDLDLFDLESVEILRGPQGTLFGRNTIGGVIQINRSRPTREFGFKVKLDLEEDNTTDTKMVFNAPLGDNGGIKVSIRKLESDSFMFNVTRDEREKARDLESASVALDFDPSENVNVQFIFDNYNDNSQHNLLAITKFYTNKIGASQGVFDLLGQGAGTSGDLSAANDYKTVYSAEPFYSGIQGNNMTFKVEWELDNHTLKYIAGNNDFTELMDICSWGSPGAVVTPNCVYPVVRDQDYEQTSHELQLISESDGPLNYTLGLFYIETEANMDSGPVGNFRSQQEAEAQAVFADFSYDVNEDWTLGLGLRYTEEEKEFAIQNYASFADKIARDPVSLALARDFKDDNLQHKIVLQRNTDFGMVYLSHSTGFRSGGFNARGSTPESVGPFNSEEVETIELGIRSELLDNRLILNLTAFTNDYTDKQEVIVTAADGSIVVDGVPQFCGTTCTFVRNAGQVSIDGIELEGTYRATQALTLRSAIGILDSGYDNFEYDGQNVAADAQLNFAPDYTASVSFDYVTNVQNGELIFAGTLSAKDKFYGRFDPAVYNYELGANMAVDKAEKLDLSVTYNRDLSNGGTMTLTVFGNDILEDGGYIVRPFDAGAFAFATPQKRQHFGISLGLDF